MHAPESKLFSCSTSILDCMPCSGEVHAQGCGLSSLRTCALEYKLSSCSKSALEEKLSNTKRQAVQVQ